MKTDELIDSLCVDLAPVASPLPAPVLTVGWTVAALGVVSALVWMLVGLRADFLPALATPRLFLTLAALIGVLGSASYLGFLLSIPGRRVRWVHRVLPMVCLLVFNLTLASHLVPEGHTLSDGCALGGLQCTIYLALLALVPGAIFILVARRLAPLDPLATAKAVGVAMGAVGAFGLTLHCGSQHGVHLLLYHSLPVFLIGSLARVAGGFILRW